MKLKTFKIYVAKVVNEGNRLQKHNINGKLAVKGRFTTTQYLAMIAATILVWALPKGFSDNFAGYIISFLGIFIGLFASIVVSLFDKSKDLFDKYSEKDTVEKAKIRRIRNYLVQFTGLTSYAILLAIVVIILLSMILMQSKLQTNIFDYSYIKSVKEINIQSFYRFLKVLAIVIHRFFIVYYLCNFFVITIFSTTSYFSYLSSQYKKMIPPND